MKILTVMVAMLFKTARQKVLPFALMLFFINTIAGFVDAEFINNNKTCAYVGGQLDSHPYDGACATMTDYIYPILDKGPGLNACGSTSINQMARFVTGTNISVTYNLYHNYTFTDVNTYFCPTSTDDTQSPTSMRFYTSNDGTNWVQRKNTTTVSYYDNMEIFLSGVPKAQYVKVELGGSPKMALMEINIQGTRAETIPPSTIIHASTIPNNAVVGFITNITTVVIEQETGASNVVYLVKDDCDKGDVIDVKLSTGSGHYSFILNTSILGVGTHSLRGCVLDYNAIYPVSTLSIPLTVLGTPITFTMPTTTLPNAPSNNQTLCVNFTYQFNMSNQITVKQVDYSILDKNSNTISNGHSVRYGITGICVVLPTVENSLKVEASANNNLMPFYNPILFKNDRIGKYNQYSFHYGGGGENGTDEEIEDGDINDDDNPPDIPNKYTANGSINNSTGDPLIDIKVTPDCILANKKYNLYSQLTNENGTWRIPGITKDSKCIMRYSDPLHQEYQDNKSNQLTIRSNKVYPTMVLYTKPPEDDTVTYTVKAYEIIDRAEVVVDYAIVTFSGCGDPKSITQKTNPGYVSYTTTDLKCNFNIACEKNLYSGGASVVDYTSSDKYYTCLMSKLTSDQNHLTIKLINGKNNPITNGNATCYLRTTDGVLRGQSYSNYLGECMFNIEPGTNYDASFEYNGIKKGLRITIDGEGQSAVYIVDMKGEISTGSSIDNLSSFIYDTIIPMFQLILLIFAFSVLFKVLLSMGQ